MILARLLLATVAVSVMFISGAAFAAPKRAHPPVSPLCAYAKRHDLKLASCMTRAAFARDYRTWSWSDDLQEAMQSGNFDWDTAVFIVDDREDYGELRESAIGFIGVTLHVVVFTERDQRTRIISLRKAGAKDVTRYVKEPR